MKNILKNIKHDTYAIYKGVEYRVLEKNNEWELISKDSESIIRGFIKLPRNHINLYIKYVDSSEIEAYYLIRTKVIYENKEYSFYPEDDEKLLLFTYDENIARHYGLAKVFGRGEFGFFAPIKDITFKEIKEKKKINGVQWWSDDEPIETYIAYKL